MLRRRHSEPGAPIVSRSVDQLHRVGRKPGRHSRLYRIADGVRPPVAKWYWPVRVERTVSTIVVDGKAGATVMLRAHPSRRAPFRRAIVSVGPPHGDTAVRLEMSLHLLHPLIHERGAPLTGRKHRPGVLSLKCQPPERRVRTAQACSSGVDTDNLPVTGQEECRRSVSMTRHRHVILLLPTVREYVAPRQRDARSA